MQSIVSLRISTHLWTSHDRRADLLEMLASRRETIEEVAFFTSFTHSVLPYDTLAQRAKQLHAIIPQFRALGLRAGINHLATMGHLDENLDNALDEPWQRITSIEGIEAKGSFCPLDPRFQQFTRDCYRLLAEAEPDFIWIDDDIRMAHHPPAGFSCFCDLCLARFSEETGEKWSRERAMEEIHNEGIRASRQIRRQWVEHNRRIFNEIFTLIRGAVDEVDPKLVLGYMPTNQLYEGMDYPGWHTILSGQAGLPVKWRPGGGFYKDDKPLDALRKIHLMGRTAEAIPTDAVDVQYEHENFPYQKLQKSETMFVAETGAAMAAGCTGVALNLMGISPDPFAEYLPYFDRIADARPFFDRLVGLVERRPCEGIWPAITTETWAARIGQGTADPLWCLTELAEIGLPPAYARGGARIHLLAGDAVRAFSESELVQLLSEAALVDGPALQHLEQLGLAELAGFETAGCRDRDTIERFTTDPINGVHAGWWRDCRPSFWRTDAHILRPLSDQSRPLAELIDFQERSHGSVMGVFENRLGGRVAVLGYYPWTSLQNLSKSTQMRTLCRWLSRDTLPAYVSSFHKVALWCRRDAAGKLVMPLLNASLDTVSGVQLQTLSQEPYHLLRLDGSEVEVPAIGTDGAYRTLQVPVLAPWEIGLIH